MAKKGPGRRIAGASYKAAKRAGRSTLRGGNLHNARASSKAGHGCFGKNPKQRPRTRSAGSPVARFDSPEPGAPSTARRPNVTVTVQPARPPTANRPSADPVDGSLGRGCGALVVLVLVVVVGWWFFAHREVDRAAVGPTPPELVNSQQCDRSRNDTASQGRLGVAGGSVVGEFRLKAVLVERPDEVRIRVGLNGPYAMKLG